MSRIFKTVNEEMTFLMEYAGVTEDFLSGAIAIGGYNEETMNGACYYLTGYTTIDSYCEEIIEENFDSMQDNIIKKYGFEATETLLFCTACETGVITGQQVNTFDILKLYNNLMSTEEGGDRW